MAVVILVGAVSVIVWAIPQTSDLARHQAQKQAQRGDQLTGSEAVGRYRLAHLLDPGNTSYQLKLATLEMQSGNADAAVTVLEGLQGPEVQVLRSQAYLEANDVQAACSAVEQGSDAAVVKQRTLCAQVLNPDGDALATAQQLYLAGLYQSTLRALASAEPAATTYELKARSIAAQTPTTKKRLQEAQAVALEGSKKFPANADLHQLVHDLDIQLDNDAGAAEQIQYLEQLRSGAI